MSTARSAHGCASAAPPTSAGIGPWRTRERIPSDTVTVTSDSDEQAAWHVDAFGRSLTSLSDHTVTAYCTDIRGFADWCARSGIVRPGRREAHHDPALPRLPHDTPVRPAQHRPQDGIAAPLLRMVGAHGRGCERPDDRHPHLAGRGAAAPGARRQRPLGPARRGATRPTSRRGGAAWTMPCWSCSTARACG